MNKADFLHKHLPHRLTLLRTLSRRPNTKYDYTNQGDVYRCIKDSNLIAVRLLMDFLGLKGKVEKGIYSLESITKVHPNDVRIDKFIGKLLLPGDVLADEQTIIAGVYVRADKELAHLTTIFNDKFNEEKILIAAAKIVESLIKKHLYDYLKVPFPEIDK